MASQLFSGDNLDPPFNSNAGYGGHPRLGFSGIVSFGVNLIPACRR
jgi:hypothetical protein